MERVRFITFKGKKMLMEDFTKMTPGANFTRLLKKARSVIASEPAQSVLAIFDATDCSFNSETLAQVKEFTKANTPFIKQSAVVGMNGLLQVALSAVSKYSSRDFQTFNSIEEAMEFLAEIE